MGGSRWAWEVGGCKDGFLPEFDLDHAVRTAAFVAGSVQKQRLKAVHDIGEGGLAVALAEMAIRSGIGAKLNNYDNHISMFNESGGRVLVVIGTEDLDDFLKSADTNGVAATVIGKTGGSSLEFGPLVNVSLEALTAAFENQLSEALGQGTVSA
jgi:phosphoribosylformylglycinamidine synthase